MKLMLRIETIPTEVEAEIVGVAMGQAVVTITAVEAEIGEVNGTIILVDVVIGMDAYKAEDGVSLTAVIQDEVFFQLHTIQVVFRIFSMKMLSVSYVSKVGIVPKDVLKDIMQRT